MRLATACQLAACVMPAIIKFGRDVLEAEGEKFLEASGLRAIDKEGNLSKIASASQRHACQTFQSLRHLPPSSAVTLCNSLQDMWHPPTSLVC